MSQYEMEDILKKISVPMGFQTEIHQYDYMNLEKAMRGGKKTNRNRKQNSKSKLESLFDSTNVIPDDIYDNLFNKMSEIGVFNTSLFLENNNHSKPKSKNKRMHKSTIKNHNSSIRKRQRTIKKR